MSELNWEEDLLGRAYDAKLMRRLLRYVSPYKGLFALSVVLVLAVTALDLSLPYLTKTAIDHYIVLSYVRVDASKLSGSALQGEEFLQTVPLEGGDFLVDSNALPEGVRSAWDALGAVSLTHYWVMPADAAGPLQELAASRPQVFQRSPHGVYYAEEGALSQLTLQERVRLRANDIQ